MDDFPADPISPTRMGQLLGLHRNTVYRWINRGRVRSWGVGGRIRVSEAEVCALATCRHRPHPARDVGTRRQRKAWERWTREVLAANGIRYGQPAGSSSGGSGTS